MERKIDFLFGKMLDKEENEALRYADSLAKYNTDEVMERLLSILQGEDMENAYLAAKALGKMDQKQRALGPLLEVIHKKENQQKNGGLVEALGDFDLQDNFVDILRIYLFGNFKASMLAKGYLDHAEFEITPRVIKKAEKHWKHYQNNSKKDDAFEIKMREITSIFNELTALFRSR